MNKPTYEQLEAQVKQLAAERDAVVAENVVLKSVRVEGEAFENIIRMPDFTTDAMDDAAWEAYLKHCNEDDHMPFGEMYRAAVMAFRGEGFDVETPATDAILASLRAEGVEMYANNVLAENMRLSKSAGMETTFSVFAHLEHEAKQYAAQLRSKSEVQS